MSLNKDQLHFLIDKQIEDPELKKKVLKEFKKQQFFRKLKKARVIQKLKKLKVSENLNSVFIDLWENMNQIQNSGLKGQDQFDLNHKTNIKNENGFQKIDFSKKSESQKKIIVFNKSNQNVFANQIKQKKDQNSKESNELKKVKSSTVQSQEEDSPNKQFLKLLNKSKNKLAKIIEHDITIFESFAFYLQNLLKKSNDESDSQTILFQNMITKVYKKLKLNKSKTKNLGNSNKILFTKLSISVLIKQINTKIRLLEQNLIDLNSPEIQLDNLSQRLLYNSKLGNTQHIQNRKLFDVEKLENVFSSFEYSTEFNDFENSTTRFFTSRESVQFFLKTVEKCGLRNSSNMTLINEKLNAQIESLKNLQIISNKDKLCKEGDTLLNLFCVKVIAVNQGKITIKSDFFELNDEYIRRMFSLYQILQETKKQTSDKIIKNSINSDHVTENSTISEEKNYCEDNFESDLQSIEKTFGSFVDLNSYNFGGLYSIVAKLENIQKSDLDIAKKLLETKVQNKHYSYLIDLTPHIHVQDDRENKQIQLYQRIKTKYYHTIDSDVFFPLFLLKRRFCYFLDFGPFTIKKPLLNTCFSEIFSSMKPILKN